MRMIVPIVVDGLGGTRVAEFRIIWLINLGTRMCGGQNYSRMRPIRKNSTLRIKHSDPGDLESWPMESLTYSI